MRAFPLLVLGLLALATSAAGQSAADDFTLLASFRDGQYVWLDTEGQENPTLRVAPMANVTIHIQQGETGGGVPHDLQVGGGATSGRIVAPGESANVTFSAPPSGRLPYTCTVHPSTMNGEIVVAAAAGEESTDDGDDVPSAPVVLLLGCILGVAMLTRRRGM